RVAEVPGTASWPQRRVIATTNFGTGRPDLSATANSPITICKQTGTPYKRYHARCPLQKQETMHVQMFVRRRGGATGDTVSHKVEMTGFSGLVEFACKAVSVVATAVAHTTTHTRAHPIALSTHSPAT